MNQMIFGWYQRGDKDITFLKKKWIFKLYKYYKTCSQQNPWVILAICMIPSKYINNSEVQNNRSSNQIIPDWSPSRPYITWYLGIAITHSHTHTHTHTHTHWQPTSTIMYTFQQGNNINENNRGKYLFYLPDYFILENSWYTTVPSLHPPKKRNKPMTWQKNKGNITWI